MFTWYYSLKHPKPIEQSPSKYLVEQLKKYSTDSKKPIADIACGYGRNGAFCVDLGYNVVFIDHDLDALNFIKTGIGVSILSESIVEKKYSVLYMDLDSSPWPFYDNALSGIILVHYYNSHLLPIILNSIEPNGFIYIETIDLRASNYLGLPFEDEIENILHNNGCSIKYIQARKKQYLSYSKIPVEALRVFAIKEK